jgi:hypothetical protein
MGNFKKLTIKSINVRRLVQWVVHKLVKLSGGSREILLLRAMTSSCSSAIRELKAATSASREAPTSFAGFIFVCLCVKTRERGG